MGHKRKKLFARIDNDKRATCQLSDSGTYTLDSDERGLMANQPHQKLKLLYILQMLLKHTDEEHTLTTQQIIDELEVECGIAADRKSIYRDLQTLREFGLDIPKCKKAWYLATRPFDMQEMVMLVDSVQSSPFLTEDMTERLIGRIKELASDGQAAQLDKRIEVPGRVKMDNDQVYENLGIIQQAMRERRKIEFHYFRYNARKERELTRGGRLIDATPVRLVYSTEFYYLIVFENWVSKEPGKNPFTTLRVDRMIDVAISEEPADRDFLIANYRLDENETPSFGVHSRAKRPIVLDFYPEAVNAIIDKFGTDVDFYEQASGTLRLYTKVPWMPQFSGWLFQMGSSVRIVSPREAVDEYQSYLRDSQNAYRRARMEERRAALPKRPEGLVQSPHEPLKDEWVDFVLSRMKARVAIAPEDYPENIDWSEVEQRFRSLWAVHVDQVHRGKPKWMIPPERELINELHLQVIKERRKQYRAEREARYKERVAMLSPERRAAMEERERNRREHMRKYGEYREEYRLSQQDDE